MGMLGNLVRQGLSVIEDVQQRSQKPNPNYSNFYVTPGEKLNIQEQSNTGTVPFYVAPNKQLEIEANPEFKSKGGLIKGYPKLAKKGWK
jgi:hypothetical protein